MDFLCVQFHSTIKLKIILDKRNILNKRKDEAS